MRRLIRNPLIIAIALCWVSQICLMSYSQDRLIYINIWPFGHEVKIVDDGIYVEDDYPWGFFDMDRNTEISSSRYSPSILIDFHFRIRFKHMMLVLALLTGVAVFRLIRSTPVSGQCSKCRYDLRGNESGTCPECGTNIKREIRDSALASDGLVG